MSSTQSDQWSVPMEVTDLDIAFPARGLELAPEWDDIPLEFRPVGSPTPEVRPYIDLADQLFNWYAGFAVGLKTNGVIEIKAGIEARTMQRHIQVVLLCYGFQHEHKIAAAAYLLSRWITFTEKGGADAQEEGPVG